MTVKYYVDISGNYMGALDGVTGVDISAWTEVPTAPVHYLDTWNGVSWVLYSAPDDVTAGFKTISVSGQSDIVADSTLDTLTVVAGSNIALTTNTITDALTIAANTVLVDGDYGDIVISSSGTVVNIDSAVLTSAGRALIDDANSSAQRTTLGLGTLATQSGTFSGTSSGTNTGDQTDISGNAATVTVGDAGGDTTTWPLLGASQTGNMAPTTDAGLTYQATTNALTATTFVGALNGNADTVTVADAGGDTTTWPMLATSQTGSLAPATDSGLTYQATTNALTATTFIGALTGNAATASSAAALTTPRTIGGVSFDGSAAIVPQTIQSINEATDTTCFPLFISSSGSQSLQPLNNTSLTFNSNTGTLGATTFSGAGTNLTGTAASLTAGNVTTNANLTGPITSSGNATAIADAELSALSGLNSAANSVPVFTGLGTADLITLTASTLVGMGSSGTATKIALGSGLSMAAAVLSTTASAGNGGSTTSSNGSSLTLTVSSTKEQRVTMTAGGLSVIMPDATTLTAGGPQFEIENAGSYSFTIRANGGAVKVILAAGESCTMWCSDISTAAGVWSSGNLNSLASELFNINPTVKAVGNTNAACMCLCPISSTTGLLLVWNQTATAAVKACVITCTGEALTSGTVTLVEAQVNTVGLSCVALDTTHVLVSYSGTTDTRLMILSISGTTVTANTAASAEAVVTQNHHLFKINSSTAYFGYSKNTGTVQRGAVISVSGTTVTVNAITSGAATVVATNGNLSICALSTTAYFYAYAGTSGFLAGQVFTVSGTAVTANTAVTNQSNSVLQKNIKCAAASGTCVVVSSMPSATASINLYTFTISGTTISQRQAYVAAVPVFSTGQFPMGVVMINGSCGFVTTHDTHFTGGLGYTQCGFKVDPINGDLQIENPKRINVSTTLTATNPIGYPLVGPITTSSGQYSIVGNLVDGSGDTQMYYMNASI